jgi:aminoglycoside 6'-N-acetyltransferase
LRLLAEQLIDEGAPLVAIDPHLDNFRARRAYQKAGFRSEREVVTGEGPAMLMIYKGEP